MTIKLQKISSKGQITLPVAWRKAVDTDHIMLQIKGNAIEIRPMHIPAPEADETVVFDAWRDNEGNPLSLTAMRDLLAQVQTEHERT